MSTAAPPLPTLPGPDGTYAQALETEAAIRGHMTEHGPAPEAMLALAQIHADRRAYRAAVAVMNKALTHWAASATPRLG